MILRRITEHLVSQNWTAVAIEFLIVVLGVVLGIQIGNWNEARRDRQTEALYILRLQQELAEITPLAAAEHADIQERYRLISQANDFFATGEHGAALGDPNCSAIRSSHIYAGAIFYPPTIKELIATGRILLIRDVALRSAILSFDQTIESILQLRTDIQIDRLTLARKYPDLIRQGLADWATASCDFQSMASNPAFLNDFVDNRRRFSAYADDVLGRQAELLKSLSAKLASADSSP
jgi:hypothetical protein